MVNWNKQFIHHFAMEMEYFEYAELNKCRIMTSTLSNFKFTGLFIVDDRFESIIELNLSQC